MNDGNKVRSWGQIVLILIGVAIGTGLVLGLLTLLFPVPQFLWKGGIGAVVGLTAAVLIGQRHAGLKGDSKRDSSN